MRLGKISLILIAFVWLPGVTPVRADSPGSASEFQEIYDLIRTNLVGLSEADLDKAAARGLVEALEPNVSLITNSTSTDAPAPLVTKSSVFENDLGYIRVGRVAEGLAQAVREAEKRLNPSNKLAGIVLDLRYAKGTDYAAAAALADIFQTKERPLLDWGEGIARAKEKKDALTLPTAVLVNRQTTGAAEALAAVLRETGAGLLFGSKTAGGAMVGREFTLKNGDKLRIATSPVKLGDATALSTQGLTPDIAVPVNPQEEKAYFEDPYKDTGRSNLLASSSFLSTNQAGLTNRPTRRPRFSEAELVRERRDGLNPDGRPAVIKDEIEKPLVQDPVLARALDVLKGLAVVRNSRS
jgi:hypothetical protein